MGGYLYHQDALSLCAFCLWTNSQRKFARSLEKQDWILFLTHLWWPHKAAETSAFAWSFKEQGNK